MANGITVPRGATSISISESGVVSATLAGNPQPQQLGSLAMSSFINAAGLGPWARTCSEESAAWRAAAGPAGHQRPGGMRKGFLGLSNINVVGTGW